MLLTKMIKTPDFSFLQLNVPVHISSLVHRHLDGIDVSQSGRFAVTSGLVTTCLQIPVVTENQFKRGRPPSSACRLL